MISRGVHTAIGGGDSKFEQLDVNQQDAAAGYGYLIESLERVLENIPITKLYVVDIEKDFVHVHLSTSKQGPGHEFTTLLEATLENEVFFHPNRIVFTFWNDHIREL